MITWTEIQPSERGQRKLAGITFDIVSPPNIPDVNSTSHFPPIDSDIASSPPQPETTKKGKFFFEIGQRCCEDYRLELRGLRMPKNKKFEAKLLNVVFKTWTKSNKYSDVYTEFYQMKALVLNERTNKKFTFTLTASCCHNGSYPHDCYFTDGTEPKEW